MVTGKYWKASHAFDTSFDRRFNVRTAGTEEPQFLTAEASLRTYAIRYEPVMDVQMQALFKMLPALDLTRFVFIDLGSGKGRALFIAANYSFRRIIGIEFSHELHDMARLNIQTYRNSAQKCFDIQPILGDAASADFPEYPTVCFINNPYVEPLIEKTAKRVDHSVRTTPRPFFIIYLHAYYASPIDALPGWSRIAAGSLGHSPYVIWRWDKGVLKESSPEELAAW